MTGFERMRVNQTLILFLAKTTFTVYIRNVKNYFVVPSPSGGWQGKREGATRPSFTTSTKQEAIDKGRGLSKHEGGELFSHGKDGKIQWRDSHGNDPYPPRG